MCPCERRCVSEIVGRTCIFDLVYGKINLQHIPTSTKLDLKSFREFLSTGNWIWIMFSFGTIGKLLFILGRLEVLVVPINDTFSLELTFSLLLLLIDYNFFDLRWFSCSIFQILKSFSRIISDESHFVIRFL